MEIKRKTGRHDKYVRMSEQSGASRNGKEISENRVVGAGVVVEEGMAEK